MTTSATATMPISFSEFAKNRGVLPSFASFSAFEIISSERLSLLVTKPILPANISLLLSLAERPLPISALKSVTSSASIFISFALIIIALASGCSLILSRETASFISSVSLVSLGIISVTRGSPLVIVPVLSSAIISTLPVCSRETAVLNNIPFLAPIPLPTIIATGVAKPNAQGQLITRTDIPLARAKPTVCPHNSQIAIVMIAIVITTGTNIPETLSATFAIGALVAAALLTIFMICESVVSSPTRVASHFINPD